MGNPIMDYELKAWLKSPLFYLFNISFFLFSLVTMLGTGGYFDSTEVTSDKLYYLNSPYSLTSMSFLLAKCLLFVVTIFGGIGLYKDYRKNTYAFLYTFPISKSSYLKGKLGSAFFAIFILSVCTFLGISIGELMLGLNNPKISAHSSFGYLVAWSIYLFPTLLIVGLIIFSVVGISRNIYSGFIAVICFVLFQLLLEHIFFNQKILLAILDPFGQNAFHLATRDWDFSLRNSMHLPIKWIVIINRILWLGIGFLAYRTFYQKFNFQYDAIWKFKKGVKKQNSSSLLLIKKTKADRDVRYSFSPVSKMKYCVQLMLYDFKGILNSWLFLIPASLGAVTIFFIQLKVANTGEFNLLPKTRFLIGAPLTIYTILIVLITFLFSGLLNGKAKLYKMDQLVDATPVSNWQLVYSKVGSITLIQVVLLVLFIFIGSCIQIINGYHNFEFDLYLFHLFVLLLPILFVWNVTSQFVHTLFPNLFIALFILLGLWLSTQFVESLGIQTNILQYNTLPNLEYSDFNGYGHQLNGNILLILYWLGFSLILLIGVGVFWNRGSLSSIKDRYALARMRFSKPITIILILFCGNFFWIGCKIFHLEQLEKEIFPMENFGQALNDYKKDWERYSLLAQPKITDVDLHIDLYPHKNRFTARGNYYLVNKSKHSMDTVLIRTGFDENTEIDWNGQARLIKEDKNMKSYLYKTIETLHPGDSMYLDFTIKDMENFLFSQNSNILKNGTYIRHDILPRIGYQFVDHQLPLTDTLVNRYNYFHRDVDYVNVHTTISTSMDQIAIAPGELIKEMTLGERNIYEFQTYTPVKFNFSFHSAQFELMQEEYSGANVQLYYAKRHGQNTHLMIAGLKAALVYNSKWFGPFPYKQIRIVEYPHTEGSYSATLTSNNIPVSEILFDLNMNEMEEKINLPFYVMAHELTHVWFGNKLMPADAEGAKMLTESIAEYITLCIYGEHFGEEMAVNFLNIQRKRYHRGQKIEKNYERPLNRVLSNQEYIAYGKGAIALNAISKSIGKEKFHFILERFLRKYQLRDRLFPYVK